MADKQKAHPDAQQDADNVLNKLDKMREDIGVETYKSSEERAKQSGNPNPTPPEDRTIRVPNRAADIAANHISAATSAIKSHEQSDAAMKADPRFERDQKVYELSQTGKIGLVPPSELGNVVRGVGSAESDAAPKNADEQVSDDMKRLHEAEERAKAQGSQSTSTQSEPENKGTPIPLK